MCAEPTYTDLADCIAQFVDEYLNRDELLRDGTVVRIVDNRCSSAYQRATEVSCRLGILRQRDSIQRRFEFAGPPSDSPLHADANEPDGCTYDALVVTLMTLLGQHPDEDSLRSPLYILGLCESEGRKYGRVSWTPAGELLWAQRGARPISPRRASDAAPPRSPRRRARRRSSR